MELTMIDWVIKRCERRKVPAERAMAAWQKAIDDAKSVMQGCPSAELMDEYNRWKGMQPKETK